MWTVCVCEGVLELSIECVCVVIQMILLEWLLDIDCRRWTGRCHTAIGTAIAADLAIVAYCRCRSGGCCCCWCRHWNVVLVRRMIWVQITWATTSAAATDRIRIDGNVCNGFGWCFRCIPAIVLMGMVRTARMIMTHLLLIVCICIRMCVMHSLIVHIHQRITGGSRCQMTAKRIGGKRWQQTKFFRHEMRREIETRLTFEMMFAVQRTVQHRFQIRFDVDQFLVQHRLPFGRLFFFAERILLLETTTTTQIRSVVEHANRIGIQRPVAAFARFLVVAWHFHKTFVERQIVSNGILPALFVLSVVRVLLHDELIDAVQRDFALGRRINGHGNECNVWIRRFHHFFVLMWTAESVGRRIASESGKWFVGVMWCWLHCRLARCIAGLRRRIMTKCILIEHCNRCRVHFGFFSFRSWHWQITHKENSLIEWSSEK